MKCDYCEDKGVVGGVMPWKNGSAHACPCPYCEGNPVIKFKPGITPWTGVIMPVPDVHKNTPGFSTWAEPDRAGERVIIVIDPRCRMWCWSEKGQYGMPPMLQSELTVLATEVMFEGHGDEYQCGVAVEGVLDEAGDLELYMLVPLIALLDGEDTQTMGCRRLTSNSL